MIKNMAVIENDTVTNIIVISETATRAFAEAIGKELYSTNEYPLQIGDRREPDGRWYRDVDGVKTEILADDATLALEILGVET